MTDWKRADREAPEFALTRFISQGLHGRFGEGDHEIIKGLCGELREEGINDVMNQEVRRARSDRDSMRGAIDFLAEAARVQPKADDIDLWDAIDRVRAAGEVDEHARLCLKSVREL